MDYKQILKVILDIGEQMINSGAEISRVEDSMYRLCRSYGFTRVNCWVISSNIQATVETPDGDIFTQIRHVPEGEIFLDKPEGNTAILAALTAIIMKKDTAI